MKKKNVVFVFLFIMLFSAAKGTTLPPPPGWGAEASVAPSGQTLYYIIRGDTAIVTYPSEWFNNYWGSFTKPTGALIIPDSVTFWGTTYPVTTIGSNAFTYCTGLTSVVLPNTVKYIEEEPFYITNITSITLSDSLKRIGNWAFRGCNFSTINLPNSLEYIGESAFAECTSLSSIIIPSQVSFIGDEAFKNCINLTSISLPEGISNINQEVFFGCSSLDSIEIPSNVTNIGWQAFKNCSNLSSVIMQSDTAPELWHNIYSSWGMDSVFGNNADGRVFRIPCGSWNSYYDNWTCYRNDLQEPLPELNVIVNANDTTRGNVSVGYHNATVACDSITVITAIPNSLFHFNYWSNGSTATSDTLHLTGDSIVTAYFIGLSINVNNNAYGIATHSKIGDHLELISATPYENYHFDHWSNGSTANPDTLNLIGDSTVMAYFTPNRYHVTVNVNDVNLGTVFFPFGDTANYNDTLMVVAIPIEHHHVVNWSGTLEVSVSKDTAWVLLNANRVITCDFAIDTHRVITNTNDGNRGVVTGDGEYVYGTPCILTAIPYTGYVFKEWSNGIQTNPYAFQVTEDVELTAIFLSEDEVGINVINEDCVDVHSSNGRIVVEGTTEEVHVFDMVGRIVRNEALPNGVYIVKIGASPARKVVVMQ